ncbi:MAG: cytidine deaminase [Syntrophomonadaceae bacterium]|nr:cytidine deaminase [Syntrophomonadaceae bacterium]
MKIAQEAREHAYAPYSGFKVGAALLDRSGRVFSGCNVENASFGLTVCAERVAVFKAISEGSSQFSRLLITGGEDIITPCGACRQVLAEFAPDLVVICASESGMMIQYELKELLPQSFALRQREA